MEIALLTQAGIFKDLTDDEAKKVLGICVARELAVGDYVFKEEDEGDQLFIIESGEVRISRKVPGVGEEALAVLKPGACFGEMSVLDESSRSTDAIAHTRCTLLTISRADFRQLLDSDRELGYKVLWGVVHLFCARLRSTNDAMHALMAMSMF